MSYLEALKKYGREKIREFRYIFGLDELDYSDEKLLEILKQYDFNFEKAFESLFS